MDYRSIVQAAKRHLWRGVKVVGLYALWRSLEGTILLLALGLYVLGAGRYLSATPLESFPIPITPPSTTTIFPHLDIRALQRTTDTLFRGLPYVGSLWGHVSPFDYRQPITYLWGLLFPLAWLGHHLLRRKVQDAPTPATYTILGSVGMMNAGTMAIKRVGSIAAHLTRISSPAEERVAQAIAHVTKAVAEARTLNEAQRTGVLDLLTELARHTALPAAKRSPSVGRAIVGALDTALNAAGNLADV